VIRVRCDALPIIDPGDEGRRIVWEGFSQAYSDFEHWHTSPAPPWPYSGEERPPLVDMLVGEVYTFVSPESDDWLRHTEALYAEYRQRWALGVMPISTWLDRVWDTSPA
jgi:hypothetical protein